MSFFLKQASSSLQTNTTDLEDLLTQKAEASQTYTMTEVNSKFTGLIAASPTTLDTLKEISTALNNDADFAGTIISALSEKAPTASPKLTGEGLLKRRQG